MTLVSIPPESKKTIKENSHTTANEKASASSSSVAPETGAQVATLAITTETTDSADTVAATPAIMVAKTTPSARSRRASNALGIKTPKKKKGPPKKRKEAQAGAHPSVGLYVDALDKGFVWGAARILEVNEAELKIKVTFPGFTSKWDIWTDQFSIQPLGSKTNQRPRANIKIWDGQTDLITCERIPEADELPMEVAPSRVEQRPAAPQQAAERKKVMREPPTLKKAVAMPPPTVATPPTLVKPLQTIPKKRKIADDTGSRAATVATGRRPKVPRTRPKVVVVAPAPPVVTGPWFELAQGARESAIAIAKTSEFLDRCADLWEQQLCAMQASDQADAVPDEDVAVALE